MAKNANILKIRVLFHNIKYYFISNIFVKAASFLFWKTNKFIDFRMNYYNVSWKHSKLVNLLFLNALLYPKFWLWKMIQSPCKNGNIMLNYGVIPCRVVIVKRMFRFLSSSKSVLLFFNGETGKIKILKLVTDSHFWYERLFIQKFLSITPFIFRNFITV